MKNLVIDIGNSRIKSALFAGDELLEETVYADLDPKMLGQFGANGKGGT